MAGIKHYLQELGIFPKNLSHIKNPIEREMAFRSMSMTPYCRLCGQEILMCNQDENGRESNWQLEMNVMAHMKCIEKERARRAGEQGR